jgi:hypothetical protein
VWQPHLVATIQLDTVHTALGRLHLFGRHRGAVLHGEECLFALAPYQVVVCAKDERQRSCRAPPAHIHGFMGLRPAADGRAACQ